MPEETQSPQPMPDPEKLKPAGLSDVHKRYIYYGVSAALVLLILANVVGSKQSTTANSPKPPSAAQQQNPSPAQIRDWENNLKQAEAQLQDETKDRQRQLDAARAMQQSAAPMTADDLQRAAALNDAAMGRQQFQQN